MHSPIKITARAAFMAAALFIAPASGHTADSIAPAALADDDDPQAANAAQPATTLTAEAPQSHSYDGFSDPPSYTAAPPQPQPTPPQDGATQDSVKPQ